jgi:hypothetical protein
MMSSIQNLKVMGLWAVATSTSQKVADETSSVVARVSESLCHKVEKTRPQIRTTVLTFSYGRQYKSSMLSFQKKAS